MLEHFSPISTSEFLQLTDAVSLITVLVAGADGNIDREEISWAKKVTEIRSYNMKADMKDFYVKVGEDFSERLNHFIDTLPQDVDARSIVINQKLTELNPILAKLDPSLGAKLYTSFTSFAEHVAKASGGILGFMTINKDEAQNLGLAALKPIIFEDEEE
jgi:hypothetical protein